MTVGNQNGNPNEELLDRARTMIRELRERLAQVEARKSAEPVAVVGMAGRFPGTGEDLDAFWEMIAAGRDAVTDVPADRWDSEAFYSAKAPMAGRTNMRRGAFLEDVSRFDAGFFDVPPVEAIRMDPQQRIFLETAWHALEDAGLTRVALRGSDTGVFVGLQGHSADYGAMQFADTGTLESSAATGTAHDVIAGRLAYWLDLRGPSLVVDTACSSSLVAVHLGCRSLRARDCSCAVVGGMNLMLSPRISIAMSQLQMLAGDGRSKTFDSRADGFGRGEGCCVVVLKRLSDAQAQGDRVLAVIRGTAVNQDGRTNGLTAPNGLAQQRLLRRALEEAGVTPAEVGYFEAHGTGTALGDPIEVEAISAVMGGAKRAEPCVLGAVKANIGHLEGGAGLAGLMKAVLVLRKGYFPPVAGLETLNPHLAMDGTGLTIPREGSVWARHGRRVASVSSFGWSGTNAHAVLEEAPEETGAMARVVGEPVVIAVSAESREALTELARAYAKRVEAAAAEDLADLGYTSTLRRTPLRHRLAVVGHDGKTLAERLRARAEDAAAEPDAEPASEVEPLARDWERGAEVDWGKVYPAGGRVVDLPGYPFQGKRYWLAGLTPPGSGVAEQKTEQPEERKGEPVTAGPASDGVAPSANAAETAPLVAELRGLEPRQRFERLLAFVSGETKALFGMPQEEPLDEERGLIDMGMDSLMTVMLQNELQGALGVELSSTLVLDYPNLTALARFLDGKLFGKETAGVAAMESSAEAVADPDEAAIAAMSQAETDAALEAELEAIRRLGVE
jgi:acyl transferase domain-containing protein